MATGELAGTTALYASTLPRAIETAEILRPALEATNGGRALDIVVDHDLRELEPGEADGLAWTDVYERWGPFDLDLVGSPWVPGGETWLDFVARVEGAVTGVADAHPGELVVIACHGGVIGGTMSPLPADRPGRRPPGVGRQDTRR